MFQKVSFTRNLKLTSPMMRGDDVVKLQKRLRIPADGIFGPLTKSAVMNWQRVHDEKGKVVKPGKGLTVDGVVGPLTWVRSVYRHHVRLSKCSPHQSVSILLKGEFSWIPNQFCGKEKISR